MDVLIIGGGVMGLTTAWELAKSGAKVCILDKSQSGSEASWAGAGILPPGHRGSPNDPLAPLLRRATELWPLVSAELKEATGIDNGFHNCGEIQFVDSDDARRRDMAEWEVNDVKTQVLTQAELHELEPAVSETWRYSYRLPSACQVRNPRHVKGLQAACRNLGVEIVEDCEVTAIHQTQGKVHAVESSQGSRTADRYLVTGGAWSAQILSMAGVTIEVEPIRGQIVLLNCGKPLFRHVLEIGSRYLVPRQDGRIVIGSTEERVGFVKENTAGGIAGLIEFARSLVPSLEQARVERCWAGLRPHTKRGTPYIGPIPGADNLFIAAGHFRAGLHLSTVTGRLAAQMVRGETPELALDAFAIS